MNGVADADADVAADDVTAPDDDIDNAKSPSKCKNSIGGLYGIQDEYYQVKQKYGLIYDRNDDVNLPPLPPESPAYAINIPCIHSNILIDGEMLSLPLFSLVYQVEQSNRMKNNVLHDSLKAIDDFPTHKINSSPGIWDDVDSIVQNYEDDEENNSFIIEEECSIGFVPGQPDNLFTFPNGKDVLDNPLFHNNHSSVDNEADVGNNVVPDTIYGELCDRSEDATPPPLPPEHPPQPSIMLHDSINNKSIMLHNVINNSIGEYETICNRNSIRKLDDVSILNVKLQVECENSTGNNLNGMQREYLIVNEVNSEYQFWPTAVVYSSDNQDQKSNYHNCYDVYSESIDSNPSKIPNYGKRVVLISSVSWLKNNVKVKNEVEGGRLFQSVYQINSNINFNKILQIVLSIFLQLGCVWTLKKNQVNNRITDLE